MDVMCSVVKETGVVTLELGIRSNGRPIYRVSWWNGDKWAAVCYRSFKTAYNTYNMICRMI